VSKMVPIRLAPGNGLCRQENVEGPGGGRLRGGQYHSLRLATPGNTPALDPPRPIRGTRAGAGPWCPRLRRVLAHSVAAAERRRVRCRLSGSGPPQATARRNRCQRKSLKCSARRSPACDRERRQPSLPSRRAAQPAISTSPQDPVHPKFCLDNRTGVTACSAPLDAGSSPAGRRGATTAG